jgi:hypothetical protein
MWDPQHLTALQASMAYYRDSLALPYFKTAELELNILLTSAEV